MTQSSISIKNISKCYKIYGSRNDRLKEWLLPFSRSRHEEKWVLRDISLEVAQGEAVGIIGMNGAGKSTLLKIITGTTQPTAGTVHFEGSVSALLELGLGFHPDFTGRDNVYMSGQLLGYTVEEIAAHMEQIEAFAEIGAAVDAPVRTYSSGMQVRLAFAVATMKRPDILIVDEALSVGDTYFQHKSFNRIKEFCEAGTTLLLVSHDAGAIQAVCDRAVLLDHGQILKVGQPQEVMDYYNAMLGGNEGVSIRVEETEDGGIKTISGNGKARIMSVQLLNEKGEEAEFYHVGEKVCLKVRGKAEIDLDDMSCGIMLKNRLGEEIYGINTYSRDKGAVACYADDCLEFNFSFPLNIGEGNYSITVALHSGETHINNNYEWCDLARVFRVVNQSKKHFVGLAYLPTEINVIRL